MPDFDMKYEHLVRDAFECGRWGDPFGLANADVYRHAVGKKDKHRLILGISAALKKLSKDNDPKNLEFAHALDELDRTLWSDPSDENIDRTILESRKLIEKYR